jgi:hypothetical protein
MYKLKKFLKFNKIFKICSTIYKTISINKMILLVKTKIFKIFHHYNKLR